MLWREKLPGMIRPKPIDPGWTIDGSRGVWMEKVVGFCALCLVRKRRIMLYHKFCAICSCFMLLLLLLAGCAAVPESSALALAWAASISAAQSNAPDAAYVACARSQRPDGTLAVPAVNTWLATGSQPRIGLALSQLDAAGQFFGIGIITVDQGSDRWTLTDNGSLARPAPGAGVPAAQEAGKAWHLPPGTYNSLAFDVPDTQPGGSVQLWVSDHQQAFVLARLYTTLQRPAGATSVTLSGQPGWLSGQGHFTIISLNLTTGIYAGLGTLLYAGTGGVQQSEQLASQAAGDLNDILPA